MILHNTAPFRAVGKFFPPVLCLLYLAFPAFAQGDVTFVGDDIIGLDVSFQFASVKTQTAFGNGVFGVGGRAGYYLRSIVFLDGEILHEPGAFNDKVWGTNKTIALGGFRFGTIFDDTIGIFAKARAGAIWLFPKELIAETDDSRVIGKEAHTVIDTGIIVERYLDKNFFLRMDMGDYIIPLGDKKIYTGYSFLDAGTTHNLGMEFGIGFRF